MSDSLETTKIMACSRVRAEIEPTLLAKMVPELVLAQIVPLCMSGLDAAERSGALPTQKRPPRQRRGRD